MELFRTRTGSVDDDAFRSALQAFPLRGASVLCHSRLFGLGRLAGSDAVSRILDVLLDVVGNDGTLCVPCYTMSAYNGDVFDLLNSRCPTGVLGEVARTRSDFRRTLHPIYSTCCSGVAAAKWVDEQKPETCFGPGSFFDLFSRSGNGWFLMLGINLSVITMCHYYDQLYGAPGRFIKRFPATVRNGRGETSEIEFDSFVKDHSFYEGRHTCLARFDALATELGYVVRIPFASNWIHAISERHFHLLYRVCLEVDQEYFLVGPMEMFTAYYREDRFQLCHGQLDPVKTAAIRKRIRELEGGGIP